MYTHTHMQRGSFLVCDVCVCVCVCVCVYTYMHTYIVGEQVCETESLCIHTHTYIHCRRTRQRGSYRSIDSRSLSTDSRSLLTLNTEQGNGEAIDPLTWSLH